MTGRVKGNDLHCSRNLLENLGKNHTKWRSHATISIPVLQNTTNKCRWTSDILQWMGNDERYLDVVLPKWMFRSICTRSHLGIAPMDCGKSASRLQFKQYRSSESRVKSALYGGHENNFPLFYIQGKN